MRVIGLDVGTTAVRAAEIEFGGGGPAGKGTPTLVRFGQSPLPPGAVRDGEVVDQAVVSHALRDLWGRVKFGSKDVVIGVGNQRVVVRELDVPWMPLPQIKASLPYQVQEMLPVAAQDALLDFFPTAEADGPNGRQVHGLLVAAQRDTVSANVLAVEGAGLRPVMVDLNAFALLRSIVHGDVASGTVAVVDVGARVTTVVIAAQGTPRLVRMLPLGGQNVTDAVARAVGATSQEAEQIKREVGLGYVSAQGHQGAAEAIAEVSGSLVESVRNTLVFYGANNPGAGVGMIVLTGGGAHLPGLGQYLSSTTRLQVVLGDPIGRLRVGKTVDRAALSGYESLTALTVGLAHGVAA
jgi:type IV pilus assembly protein PilM